MTASSRVGAAPDVGRDFLLIGRAGMDLYADPPGTEIESARCFTAALGGSSANIAVGLTCQGMNVALVTRVSDDAIGRFCMAELGRYGVDIGYVNFTGGEPRTSLAVVETRSENCETVIYRNNAADFRMSEADIDAVDFSRFSAVIATGTTLAAEPSRRATFLALQHAREGGLSIILDLDYRPYSWTSAQDAEQAYTKAASLCDVVVGNDDEFGVMAGGRDKGLQRARDLASTTAAAVVYKMGEHGARTLSGGDVLETGVFRVDALKPTGAGDGFMAGFVAALANGADLEAAVLRGSATAAIVVSRIGCAPAMPTAAEVDRFLLDRPGPTRFEVTSDQEPAG